MSVSVAAALLPAALLLVLTAPAGAAGDSPFTMGGVCHVARTQPIAETRGFHFVASVPAASRTPATSAAPARVFGCGILGELVEVEWSNASSPAVLANEQSNAGLVESRTLLVLPANLSSSRSQRLLLAARTFQTYDISQPGRPQLLSNVSVASAQIPVKDNGMNGLVQLWLNNGSLLVLGAAMPGWLNAVVYNPGSDTPVVVGQRQVALAAAFDLTLLPAAGGQPALLAVVSAKPTGGGLLAVYAVLPEQPLGAWPLLGVLKGPTWSGCNRVRAHRGFVFISCFGPGANNVVSISLARPDQPRVVRVMPYVDEQPTGMLVQGQALLVAGGRDFMVFNISDPAATAGALATCGPLCRQAAPSPGQNFHTPAVAWDAAAGQYRVYLSAQIDNNLGMVRVAAGSPVAALFGQI